MPPLTHPDLHHVKAAAGWLELGNFAEAMAELLLLSPEALQHPDVLPCRYDVAAHERNWEEGIKVASLLAEHHPDRPSSWLKLSTALHRAKRTDAAFDTLLPQLDKFRGTWMIPFNLACYCAALGRFEEAKEFFKKAAVIDGDAVSKAGVNEPDLKPLWESMSQKL